MCRYDHLRHGLLGRLDLQLVDARRDDSFPGMLPERISLPLRPINLAPLVWRLERTQFAGVLPLLLHRDGHGLNEEPSKLLPPVIVPLICKFEFLIPSPLPVLAFCLCQLVLSWAIFFPSPCLGVGCLKLAVGPLDEYQLGREAAHRNDAVCGRSFKRFAGAS